MSPVDVTDPYLPLAAAVGSKRDVFSVRGVSGTRLFVCSRNQLCGGNFRVQQILAPYIYMAGAHRICQFVTPGENGWAQGVLSKRKSLDRTILDHSLIQLEIITDSRSRND